MAQRNFRRRAPFRRGGNLLNRGHWSAEQGVHNPATGALAFSEIYNADVDGEVNALQGASPTVHRMILMGTVSATIVGAATVAIGIARMSVAQTPGFGTSADPGNANNLFQDDWLWTERLGLVMVTAVGVGAMKHITADIRVKRKLHERERLVLVTSNAAAGIVVSFTWAVRMWSKLNV